MALPAFLRRSGCARRRGALAARPAPGRPRLHLVRDLRGDSPAARPSRRPLPGLLEGRRALARRRRGRLAAARLRLRAPLRPPAGGGRSAAPPALSDQVLPADDAVRRASRGIRGGPVDGPPAPKARSARPGNGGAALRRSPSRPRGKAGCCERQVLPLLQGLAGARPGAPVGHRAHLHGRRSAGPGRRRRGRVHPVLAAAGPRRRIPARVRRSVFRPSLGAAPLRHRGRKGPPAAAGAARGHARKRPALRLTAAAGVQRPRHGDGAPGPAAARLEARARPDRGAHPGHRRNFRRALPLRRGPGRIVRLLQPTRRRGVQRLDGRRAQPAPARLRRPLDPGGRGRGVPGHAAGHGPHRGGPAAGAARAREPDPGAALGRPRVLSELALGSSDAAAVRDAGPVDRRRSPRRPGPGRRRRRGGRALDRREPRCLRSRGPDRRGTARASSCFREPTCPHGRHASTEGPRPSSSPTRGTSRSRCLPGRTASRSPGTPRPGIAASPFRRPPFPA